MPAKAQRPSLGHAREFSNRGGERLSELLMRGAQNWGSRFLVVKVGRVCRLTDADWAKSTASVKNESKKIRLCVRNPCFAVDDLGAPHYLLASRVRRRGLLERDSERLAR